MLRLFRAITLFILFLGQSAAGDEHKSTALVFAIPELGDSVSVTALANRIYREAFGRLGFAYEARKFPGDRGIMLAEQEEVDGLVHRAKMFQAEHPALIRVEESVGAARIVAFTTDAELRLSGWESLRNLPLEVDWWQDVRYIGRKLEPIVPAERLETVASQESGLRKLLAGRADLFVTIGEVLEDHLAQPEFKDQGIRAAGELDRIELYPYLAPQHRELAPKLAETLRQMKAEGLFEQYRREIAAERP